MSRRKIRDSHGQSKPSVPTLLSPLIPGNRTEVRRRASYREERTGGSNV